MFRSVFAADIGSRNTRLALDSGCRTEPTLIALSAAQTLRVKAVGTAALAEPGARIAPVREGTVANTRLLALLLSEFAREHTGRRAMQSIDFCAALPKLLPALKLNAFRRTAQLAGFHSFRVLNSSLLGAIGAGVDVFAEKAAMVVDIGAETVRLAVIASGGLLFESAENFGSTEIDRAIRNHFLADHRVMIGSRMAEIIKQRIDNPTFVIDGRSAESGLPCSVRADCAELRTAADAAIGPVLRLITDAVRTIQPDAAADLLENGITLIGGGARFSGIAEHFSRSLGVPVRTAENAETAVAEGMRRYLFLDRSLAGRLRPDFMDAADLPFREREAGARRTAHAAERFAVYN